MTSEDARPLLAVLLPVRNGAADLPDWFASVERFADAVFALDDGSTDDTTAILRAHPLVQTVLSNRRRDTYEGWNDAQNRQRLVNAAEELRPRWLLFLDADERIDPDDAAALRAFLESGPLEDRAYGFEVFRMAEDMTRHDPAGLWVYRLFAWRPGLQLPEKRLHFVPIPRDIPRRRVVRTTIRIQHVGSLNDARRTARRAKYAEADPGDEFQEGYDHILDPPAAVAPWPRRAPGTPVLLPVHGAAQRPEGYPALSAVVIAQDDETTIERSLRALVAQQLDVPFEVIVVTSGSDRTAEIVRTRFCDQPDSPPVRLVELDHPVLPGEARNHGWRIARGDYVTFPGSHVELLPGSLQARYDAHEDGWAMVTGATHNGNRTRAGWASYFLDHSTLLPRRPAGELATAPTHASYVRFLLDRAGGFPEDMRAGEDTTVNLALWRRGYSAYRAPSAAIAHTSRATTARGLARHHFTRGRALGRILLANNPSRLSLLRRRGPRLAIEAPRRVRAIRANVRRWASPAERSAFRGALPLVILGALAASAGTWFELLRPGRRPPAR